VTARLRYRRIAVLVAVASFGLFALTTGRLVGYEGETAAVTEGLVKTGELRVLPGTKLTDGHGLPGRGGFGYSRTGLTQPILEVPFYWLGEQIDDIGSSGRGESARQMLLRLYNPAMAAITVAAIFCLLVLRGISERRSVAVCALCAVGSLIWPYSKLGLDTTLMATVALAVLAATWVAARPRRLSWALAGVAAGLAANAKPYGAVIMVGLLPLLADTAMRMSPAQRRRAAVAFAIPVLVSVAAMGWYNWYRFGSVTDFGNRYFPAYLLTPINAIGLFASPGKGLVFYSPLVVLGLLGMRQLWAQDRLFAWTVILTVAANTLVIATSAQWGDETWGPRYIVPSAWLLVVPIAWWATTPRRVRAVKAVAVVAICVQFVAVFAWYGASEWAVDVYAGAPVYPYGTSQPIASYAQDGPRWIAPISPLLFQFELVAAYLKEQVTGTGFTVTYSPFGGVPRTIDLSHPQNNFFLSPLPDFWWDYADQPLVELLLVIPMVAALTLAGRGLVVGMRRQSAMPAGDRFPRRQPV
jgi:hypothetical protein